MTVSSISSGKVITASDALILGKSKIITAARTGAAASGDVAYTGVGFQPRTIISFTEQPSWGFADQTLAEQDTYMRRLDTASTVGASAEAYLITLYTTTSAVYYQKAALKSLDSDGFTLNWDTTSVGDPISFDIAFLCLG